MLFDLSLKVNQINIILASFWLKCYGLRSKNCRTVQSHLLIKWLQKRKQGPHFQLPAWENLGYRRIPGQWQDLSQIRPWIFFHQSNKERDLGIFQDRSNGILMINLPENTLKYLLWEPLVWLELLRILPWIPQKWLPYQKRAEGSLQKNLQKNLLVGQLKPAQLQIT